MRHAALAFLMTVAACGKPAEPIGGARHIFKFSWALVNAGFPDPKTAPTVDCSRAGVGFVGVAFQDRASESGEIFPFEYPCSAEGDGVTEPLPDSYYNIAAAALDRDKKVLVSVKGEGTNLGGDKHIGKILFAVRPR